MTRSRRIALTGGLCLVVFSVGGPALADVTCGPLEVACVAAGGAADAVDDAADIVAEATDRVSHTIDPVAQPILHKIDDLVGGGVVDPPVGRDVGRHTVGPGASHHPREKDPSKGAGTDRGGGVGTNVSAREGGGPPFTDISARRGSRSDTPDRPPGASGGVVQAAIRDLLLLVTLFAITLGFVLLQDRVDRNDPKLALAPVHPDVVRFE